MMPSSLKMLQFLCWGFQEHWTIGCEIRGSFTVPVQTVFHFPGIFSKVHRVNILQLYIRHNWLQ